MVHYNSISDLLSTPCSNEKLINYLSLGQRTIYVFLHIYEKTVWKSIIQDCSLCETLKCLVQLNQKLWDQNAELWLQKIVIFSYHQHRFNCCTTPQIIANFRRLLNCNIVLMCSSTWVAHAPMLTAGVLMVWYCVLVFRSSS